MGLDTELKLQKYCRVRQSPSVHHSHCYSSNAEDTNVKGNPTRIGYNLKGIGQEYTEISFDDSQNSFYKNVPYGPTKIAGNKELKRGSIYQSSKEVRKMKEMVEFEGRQKIELLHSSDTSLSFQIVNSLSKSNDSSPCAQQKRSSQVSSTTDLGTTLDNKTYMEQNSGDSLDPSFHLSPSPANVACKDSPSDNFFEICPDTEDRKHESAESDRGTVEKLNFRHDQSIGSLHSDHCLLGRDRVLALQKSSSPKVGMSHSRFWSKSDHHKTNAKARFNPIRRMLDPIMKPKTQQSQPVPVAEFGDVTPVGLTSIWRNNTVCKSLLNNFSSTIQKEESSPHVVKKDNSLDVVLSPAHLHGLLKLENKHGVPFLEFSLNTLEDTALVAKTWKGHNAFNWVYTFHSLNSRRKSSNGWGSKEKHKEASMVGQMQVSCYLCSEMRNAGGFDNSMVTEFVLYDIAHARKSFSTQESPDCQADPIKPSKDPSIGDSDKSSSMDLNVVLDTAKLKHQARRASDDSDVSTPYPWAPADLHPYLETAAVVIQVPFQKRESLKDKEGVCGKASSNLFDFSVVEQRSEDAPHNISPAKVKAVTSTSTHGLPSTEDGGGGGPSPLLDRWRSGGGCDCGGWDMACPLVVLGNPNSPNIGDHQQGNLQPLELFVQGGKENIPALTMNLIDEGQYSVDFHAQLSTLQAFSICVAILHSAADCTGAGQGRTRQMLQCNSLKLLLEEEVRFLIEAVAEEEKRKVTKGMEEIPSSFVVDPPSSPIARV